ncbi:hypothetical protein [Oceanirhabdus seepicola]|uniref:BIG2 domain-containing protein n=1 Tax=Oceanirhabdus seepicola TaxID=2828781 RepID=A0A9J6P5L7_9CLOT|nr:hypothetical protein [Oceanirhabdus seepicola]MCM1990832.1 hypothetical protein [Oceanirhabdus seepicola]
MKRLGIVFIFCVFCMGYAINVYGDANEDFLLVGNKKFTIEYASDFMNSLEISKAIIESNYNCYFNINNKWYDLDGNLIEDEDIIKSISYKKEMKRKSQGELKKENINFDDYDEQIIESSLYIDETEFIYFVLKDGEAIDVTLDGKSIEVKIINTQILIKPKKAGTSKIVVKNKNTEKIRHIRKYNVLNIKKEDGMKFNANDLTLREGETFQLKANGKKLSNFKHLNIANSRKGIIDVHRDGLIKALQPGRVVFEIHNEETEERICFLINVVK